MAATTPRSRRISRCPRRPCATTSRTVRQDRRRESRTGHRARARGGARNRFPELIGTAVPTFSCASRVGSGAGRDTCLMWSGRPPMEWVAGGHTMKTRSIAIATATLAALFALSPVARANPSEAQATYQDIQKTLGLVPGFLKAFPETGIAAAWDELKSVQLNPNSALPGKTKELIGLAVAAQIPCRYCIYFHTQIAKLDGASDRELKDAIAMAAPCATEHRSLRHADRFRRVQAGAVPHVCVPQASDRHWIGDARHRFGLGLQRHRAHVRFRSDLPACVSRRGDRRGMARGEERPSGIRDGGGRQDQGADWPRHRIAGAVPVLHLLPHRGGQAQRRDDLGRSARPSRWRR